MNVMYNSSSDVHDMWQLMYIEIEDYSITYFDHIAAFEALYC